MTTRMFLKIYGCKYQKTDWNVDTERKSRVLIAIDFLNKSS